MMNKTVSVIALLLIAAQVLLVLLSWLLSAMMTEGVHSLLSGEGVRWFFGSFTHMVASPLLAWLLLLCMAGGCLVKSGLWRAFSHPRTPVPRTSNYPRTSHLAPRTSNFTPVPLSFRLSFLALVVYVIVLLLLTAVPHAVLLSATGTLWPSPFSSALLPVVAFGIILVSSVYGLVSHAFSGFTDICASLSYGIARQSPLIFLYILAVQFFESLRYVFL